MGLALMLGEAGWTGEEGTLTERTLKGRRVVGTGAAHPARDASGPLSSHRDFETRIDGSVPQKTW